MKPGSKRSRMDVITSILEKSNRRASETLLLHTCDLSLPQFKIYREFLVQTGLLKVSGQEEGLDIFETTDKGRGFLRDYARVKVLLGMTPERQKAR